MIETNPKILVADTDNAAALHLQGYMRRRGFLVAVAGDGEHAIQLHRHWRPDLVLLDILLPTRSNLDVLAAIGKEGDTPVIVLTEVSSELAKIGALLHGADDYVVKPCGSAEIVARIKAVLRRIVPRPQQPEMVIHGRIMIDTVAMQAKVIELTGDAYVALDLTQAEFNLLLTMVRSPYRAFTRKELLAHCSTSSATAERAVDNHIHNLRRKIETGGLQGALVTVRSFGYRIQ